MSGRARLRFASIRHSRCGLAFAVITLAGCASFSADGGFDSVKQVAQERLSKDLIWPRNESQRSELEKRVTELLSRPLSVDDAVQLALFNNRALRSAFAELSISEADLVQAGRLPNPHFAMLRASKPENGVREFKIEQALTFNVFSLVTMPIVVDIERRRFEQTQRAVALEMLRLSSETRKAYYTAVSANQILKYRQDVVTVAKAGADLAQRMAIIGNFNRLQHAREQGFYADAMLNLAVAEQNAMASRERLIRLLGVWGDQTHFQLPERLPDLPAASLSADSIEQIAIAQRLDLQIARIETEALAKNLGLSKITRFVNVLEFGPARVLEGQKGDPYKRGFEVAFELPLFDWGGAKVAKAEAIYMRQLDVAAQQAIDARSEVRESYVNYRNGLAVARHFRDAIVPLRRRISEENLLRYNGMLIGVFELLADARSQVAAVTDAIEAHRNFWIAQADLEMALLGRPSLASPTMTPAGAQSAAAGH